MEVELAAKVAQKRDSKPLEAAAYQVLVVRAASELAQVLAKAELEREPEPAAREPGPEEPVEQASDPEVLERVPA